jgi:hypothetical protein
VLLTFRSWTICPLRHGDEEHSRCPHTQNADPGGSATPAKCGDKNSQKGGDDHLAKVAGEIVGAKFRPQR